MKKRAIGIVALLMAMLLLLTACGNSIEGTWQYTGGSGDGAAYFDVVKQLGGTITFTFKSGKLNIKMEAMGESETIENTYTINGNKLTLSSDGSTSEAEFKVDGKKLTLTIEGSTLNFEKK